MSRVGKKPIDIPDGVEIEVNGPKVRVKGPKGELSGDFSPDMDIQKVGTQILVERPSDQPNHRSLHGLTRSLIDNMAMGVSKGFSKTLEIVGVGYRATKKGEGMEIAVGYSNAVAFDAVPNITLDVPIPTRIVISGVDKQLVGQVAAQIRAIRPPEPYKGKGIRYADEHVRRKVGKTAK